jgi:hypothetical protein
MTRSTLSAPACAALLSLAATHALAQDPQAMQAPPGPPAEGRMGGGMMLPRATDQVAPWADRLFARLDANQDGSITGDEMATLTRPEVASRGGSRLRGMISQSDANRDARVNREELSAGAGRMFARMDRNSDGRLEDDELPQPPAPPRPMAIPMPQPSQMPMPMPPEPSGG